MKASLVGSIIPPLILPIGLSAKIDSKSRRPEGYLVKPVSVSLPNTI